MLNLLPSNPPTPPAQTAASMLARLDHLESQLPSLTEIHANAAFAAEAEPTPANAEAAEEALAAVTRQETAIRNLRSAHAVAAKRETATAEALKIEALAEQAGRVEKLLAKREKVAAELAAALSQACDAFRRLVDLSERAAVAHIGGEPVQAMLHYALGPAPLQRLVAIEAYRLSGVEPLLANPEAHRAQFPGSQRPDQPIPRNQIKPFVDAIREADDFAASNQNEKIAKLRAAAGQV